MDILEKKLSEGTLKKTIFKFPVLHLGWEADGWGYIVDNAGEREIHGFEYNKLNGIAGSKVNKVARGGFFGGPKNTIGDVNGIYYGLLKNTLEEGYMGTEESIFSIMCYKHTR